MQRPSASTTGRLVDGPRGTILRVLCVAVASAGCAAGGGIPPASSPFESPVPPPGVGSETPAPPTSEITASPAPELAAVIDAVGAPLALAIAYDSVWVSSHRGPNLYRIDPTTNAVGATIDVGGNACGDIGIGEGQVWLFTCPRGQTVRIDPESDGIVGSTLRGGGAMPGFGAGSIWLTAGAGTAGRLLRLDATTEEVQAEIRVGSSPAHVVLAFDSVWVSNFDDATVSRVDPATNTVTATIPVGPPGGPGSGYMAVAGNSLWVANTRDGWLYRIDPEENVSTPVDIGAKPLTEFYDRFVSVGLGDLWVRTEDRIVARIDPETGDIVGTYPADGGGGDVAASHGSLWVANFGDDTVWRIPVD